MEYIFIGPAVIILCLALGWFVGRHLKKTKIKHNGRLLIAIAMTIVVFIALFLLYFIFHSHAGDNALKALKGTSSVSVEKVSGGYYFDGPGEDRAIIFYSGGKVQSEAYAPLMLKLSDAGFDCFLADMPLSFPLFGNYYANKFISSYNYDSWIMAGHSMGGIVASSCAGNHVDEVDGIILLAAYPLIQIDDSITLLLIHGSEDGCLNLEGYENSSPKWPQNTVEYVISGGNHAQYGDYGIQKGDGIATITCDEQIDETVWVIQSNLGL